MNYYLGIELNGNQLKISAFKKKGSTFEIVKLESFNLSVETSEAIRELTSWVNRNLPNQTSIKAVLTVSESVLYIKEIQFPKMENYKLNEAVYWEIPSVAPIAQSDAVYDWQVVSEEKGILNVLVIVGKSSYIQNIIRIFGSAQIDIVVIEPSSYAFARVANAPFNTNTLLCIAEQQGMDFIILKKGIPFFTTSTTGSTQSQKVMRIKSGIDLTNDLVTEGKKIINYWESKESLKINQVVVAGDLVYKYIGLSTSLNLFPPIQSYVGTYRKTRFLNTGEYTNFDLNSYIVSLGAASRHLHKDVFEGINLFPPEEKQKTESIRVQKKVINQLMTFVYVNIAIIIILISSILILNTWEHSLEKQQLELSNLLSDRYESTQIENIKNANSVIENVISLIKRQDDLGAKLKIISDLTPQTVKLTSVSLTNSKSQEWTIKGKGDRENILAYYNKISKNAKASDVTMPYSNFNKNSSDNEFTILIKW